MKYQSKKQEIRRVSGSARALAASALVLLMASLLVGCSVTSSRVITATHWGAQQDQGSARAAAAAPAPAPAPVVEVETEGADVQAAPADGADEESAGLEAPAPAPLPSSSASRGDMTLYIGYTEVTSAQTIMNSGDTPLGLTSHVRFCNLKPDASLVCNESPELNKMLNPHINE